MTTNTIRKRALPRVWLRFYQLERGEFFSCPDGALVSKTCFVQVSCTERRNYLFLPWTRVRSNRLVRDVRPGGKTGPDKVAPTPTGLLPCRGVFVRDCGSRAPHNDDNRTGPSA